VGGVLVVEMYSLDGRDSALKILKTKNYSASAID
jgi:hypothetical protein